MLSSECTVFLGFPAFVLAALCLGSCPVPSVPSLDKGNHSVGAAASHFSRSPFLPARELRALCAPSSTGPGTLSVNCV